MLKSKEIRAKTAEELDKELTKIYKEMAKERAHISAGTKPENPKKLRTLRRTVARIKTINRERQLMEATKDE